MNRRTVIGTIAGSSLIVLTGTTTKWTTEDSSKTVDNHTTESVNETPRRLEMNEPAEENVAFELALSEITECGTTCREVTATITNVGDTDATNVDVTVTLSADGDDLWETTEEIGTLEAGASVTQTQHIDLGVRDGLAVRNNGYQVTITTLITSDQHTERIVRKETV